MDDDSAFGQQSEVDPRAKKWGGRLRGKFKEGKLAAFKKHKSGSNSNDVNEFLRPNSSSPTPPNLAETISGALRTPSSVPTLPGGLSQKFKVDDKDYPFEKYQPHKPSRRRGLSVGFVWEEPELIGEGGDEAEDAPAVIAEQRSNAIQRVPSKPAELHGDYPPPRTGETPDIPSIRRPLQRAPTGLEEIRNPPAESTTPSSSSSEYLASQPASSPTTQKFEPPRTVHPPSQPSMRLGGDVPRYNRDSRDGGSPKPTSETQPGSSKGLRRMRADEGLTHKTSVRNSYTNVLREDALRPGSGSSLNAPAPPFHSQMQRYSSDSDRSASQRSFGFSPSPQPPAHNQQYPRPPPSAGNSSSRQDFTKRYSLPQAPSPSHDFEIPRKPYENDSSSRERSPRRTYPVMTELPLRSKTQRTPQSRQEWSPARSPLETVHNQIPRSNLPFDPEMALEEFANRVARTSALFNLSVEAGKTEISLLEWFRAAIWWFLRGRGGVEDLLGTNRPSSSRENSSPSRMRRPPTAQHYLNLAKAWWILCEVIPQHAEFQKSTGYPDGFLHEFGLNDLIDALKHLLARMLKMNLMPAADMQVQGLDTRIWMPPTRLLFPPEWLWILSGKIFKAPDDPSPSADPLFTMPIGDTQETICCGRVFAQTSVASGEEPARHEPFPCVVTILRNKADGELEMALSTQGQILHVNIQSAATYGITWEHVRWDPEDNIIRIKLPQKLRLRVYCSPPDYKFLIAQSGQAPDRPEGHAMARHPTRPFERHPKRRDDGAPERPLDTYARVPAEKPPPSRSETSYPRSEKQPSDPRPARHPTHTAQPSIEEKILASSLKNPSQPRTSTEEKIPVSGTDRPRPSSKRTSKILKPYPYEALLHQFQLTSFQYTDNSPGNRFPSVRQGASHMAVFEQKNGFRLATVTADQYTHAVDFVIDRHRAPIEYAVDSRYPDIQLRLNEDPVVRRSFMAFELGQQRDHFRDLITGTFAGPNDVPRLTSALSGVTFTSPQQGPLIIDMKYLQVLEEELDTKEEEDDGIQVAVPALKDLRLTIYDRVGSVAMKIPQARLGIPLKLRLDARNACSIQLLHSRSPSNNNEETYPTTFSAGPNLDSVDLFHTAIALLHNSSHTTQTLTFPSQSELHSFETAVSGYTVLFDGIASHFAIPRRRMMVPIYKHWETSNVRVQILQQERMFRFLAFFEGYELADCLNIVIKSSDAFENAEVKTHSHQGKEGAGAGDERSSVGSSSHARLRHKDKERDRHHERNGSGSGAVGKTAYAVKMVDAKFLLPGSGLDDEDLRNGVGVVRPVEQRFLGVETDEYAAEHEDIMVGFEREDGMCFF
ncbi:MAG: hypothetical protein M1831_006425 [Alyxoria varia]|nr:MAG: hypothetical protein M1831_006425 [Alyxoria varia]